MNVLIIMGILGFVGFWIFAFYALAEEIKTKKIIRNAVVRLFGHYFLPSCSHHVDCNKEKKIYDICYCVQGSECYYTACKSFYSALNKVKDLVSYSETVEYGEYVFDTDYSKITIYLNRNIPQAFHDKLKDNNYNFIAVRVIEKDEAGIKSQRETARKKHLENNSLKLYNQCLSQNINSIDTVEEMDVLWDIANTFSINDMTLAIDCYNRGKELYESSNS